MIIYDGGTRHVWDPRANNYLLAAGIELCSSCIESSTITMTLFRRVKRPITAGYVRIRSRRVCGFDKKRFGQAMVKLPRSVVSR